jgi:hypothetical protein
LEFGQQLEPAVWRYQYLEDLNRGDLPISH